MKFYNKSSFKRINRKNLIISICIIILLLLLLIAISLYIANNSFRNIIDTKVFRKSITSKNSTTVEFLNSESTNIFSYDKYIAILDKNNCLTSYNSAGNKMFEFNINLNNPISASNNRFLCLAEKNGKKIYLISGQNIVWQKDIEGNISKISVNKNGYISVVITGTSYKSVISVFDPTGKELFKTYLSNTLAMDTSISNDNKCLALAEIDYSATSIQSNIKILSIEKSQTDPINAINYIYPASSGSIVSNIKYNSKNKLLCMYNDSIHIINNNADSELCKFSDKNDLFADINLDDTYVKVSDNANSLFSAVEVHLFDTLSSKETIYNTGGTPKSIYCNNNLVAINLGSDIHFINTSGWLLKKFSTTQEAKDIVIGNGIAGIVYKSKIEIINL